MNDYMYRLKNKYGYSDELLNFLSELIPYLIIYYGEEYKDIILEALMNCEIHFQNEGENPKIFLNKYFNTDEEWNIPFSAGAFYRKKIDLKNNQLSEKSIIYIVTRVDECYFPFRFDNDRHIDKLIHEILHLIKGYGKLKIEEDHIIDSSGLRKDFYKYDPSGVITFNKHQNNGIEEALNCAEASQILEMMTGRKQEIQGYTEAGEIAKVLLENDVFTQTIRKSQFSGDDSWIQFLGEEQSEILIENLEILVLSKFASFRILKTPEMIKQFNQVKQNAKDKLTEFLNSFFSKKI